MWRSRTWISAAITVGIVLLSVSFFGIDRPEQTWIPLAIMICVIAAVLVATLRSVRRERHAHEERLTMWAAERAAQEERLRIARELHDLASHGLGLITVRAAAAHRVRGPHAGAEQQRALHDIERAGRQATTELRRMLTVLRSDEQQRAPLRPAETLHDLSGILDAARDAGVTVTAELDGLEQLGETASAGVQLTACAIVREALTNTARHAGPAEARVALRRDGRAVLIEIEDRGPVAGWDPAPGAGHGLDGLRERVAALSGIFEAGRTAHGFRVAARLPDGAPL